MGLLMNKIQNLIDRNCASMRAEHNKSHDYIIITVVCTDCAKAPLSEYLSRECAAAGGSATGLSAFSSGGDISAAS